ncbi:MAG: 23S rRNA (adenine(2503)-C(2))-methyltransferase RlmN, partial [Candidatus Omnitrophica bacterium]|nr:23S rRNA (adenine(2503)-C(2))-methyltransferase RlmN [Candidatus Omnitrophota bacterium]
SLINVLNLTPEELKKRFAEMALEPYRADQVLRWIYEKGVYDFDRMTNLSLASREKLKANFSLLLPAEKGREESKEDKSTKLLLKLTDGDLVETVYIPRNGRETVCVSSQAGCKFHCAFCASGQAGFFRNLSMGEMVAEVLLARDVSPNKKLTNIVFMGIGEPFDNYRELLRTIRTLNSKNALGIGARRITVSTCGVVPKIETFAGEGLQVELSVSLHGATDTVRGAIMPVNKAYPVKTLVEACKRYVKKTRRAITFEYILIRGVNAGEKEARDLAKLLKGLLCKANLIPYNPIEEFPHEAPTYPDVVRFQQILQKSGIRTTVRFSKGRDIQAACGQLRSSNFKATGPAAAVSQ